MDDSNHAPSADHLRELVEAGAVDEAVAFLSRLETLPADDRKAAVQTLRTLADDQPAAVMPLTAALTPFLTDTERPVRLSTAKLYVTLAAADPEAVVDSVPSLAERLADDGEFYYVRARAAEAIGYAAVDHPSVVTPEILADLRIGLSFDEPEVTQKLAKALAYVALGNPGRLSHHVSDLAAHLDNEDELVRYHLATALVAVGCEHPNELARVADTLSERTDDPNPYVRGRSAEALGLVGRAGLNAPRPDDWGVEAVDSEAAAFLAPRAAFAAGETPAVEAIGSLSTIRARTDEIVATITAPAGDVCPNCGMTLPESGPPMCPTCGRPV